MGNMEAIKVLKECEFENRFATPEEQIVLSKYNGSGTGVFSIAPREVTLRRYSFSEPSVGVMADVNVIEIKTKNNNHFFYTEELQLESCTCIRR